MTYSIGYIIGSIAEHSLNRRLAGALIDLAPAELAFSEIPIRDLPLYSYDHDADYPPQGRALKAAIEAADAVLIVTPEYNRGIPGALKNAIDWASRPYGQNAFAEKPSAIIGASMGRIGTALAQASLRATLAFCNSPQLYAPEAYIQVTSATFADDGTVADEATRTFLADYLRAFAEFVARQVG